MDTLNPYARLRRRKAARRRGWAMSAWAWVLLVACLLMLAFPPFMVLNEVWQNPSASSGSDLLSALMLLVPFN